MKLIIHASTADSVPRARTHALQVIGLADDAGLTIVVTDEAVSAALAAPDPRTDHLLVLCETALAEQDLARPTTLETTRNAAFLMGKLQRKGWGYVRA